MIIKPSKVHSPDGKAFFEGEAPAENAAVRNKIAAALHYPDHWDTAAYPLLDDAIWEVVASAKLGCSECADLSTNGEQS